MMPNPHKRRFFVTKSGRHYFLTPTSEVWFYNREAGTWTKISRTASELLAEPRMTEVDSPDEFVFYARNAYLLQFQS